MLISSSTNISQLTHFFRDVFVILFVFVRVILIIFPCVNVSTFVFSYDINLLYVDAEKLTQ